MSSDILLISDENRVRTLTLNRTDQLNAFNDALYDACTAALNDAAEDSGIAVVILTGAGRAYSAGQDLGEMANRPTYDDGKDHGFPFFRRRLETFPKPMIAAVNGIGIGIGLTMLPYFDFVIMGAESKIKAPFVTLGLTGEAASTYLLPVTIGWTNTAQILYTTEWVSAEEAVRMGLARNVAEPGKLMDEANALASKIAPMPIPSLVATKKLLTAARADAVQAAFERENEAFSHLLGAPANLEALAAFREKREADFTKI